MSHRNFRETNGNNVLEKASKFFREISKEENIELIWLSFMVYQIMWVI